MKKQLAATAAVILALISLAGCKSKSQHPFDYDLSKYITLGKYTGVEYTYSVDEVTPEAITKFTNEALSEKGYGEVKSITDRPVQNGDTVNIAFVGKMNGEEFQGGSAESYDLEIGSNSFIDGFEAGLIGVSLNETKVLNLKFPENYGNEEFNGKDVEFTVTVNSIETTIYPELTDEIVKEISDCESIADFNTYANDQIMTENEQNAVTQKETDIWNKIVESTELKSYPKGEVEHYKDMLLKLYDRQSQSSYGVSYEELLSQAYNQTLDDIDPQLTEQAQQTVKEYMTIVAIARDQDLDLTDEEYQAEADKTAAANGYNSTSEFMEAIEEDQFYLSLLYDRVMDFIVENAVEIK